MGSARQAPDARRRADAAGLSKTTRQKAFVQSTVEATGRTESLSTGMLGQRLERVAAMPFTASLPRLPQSHYERICDALDALVAMMNSRPEGCVRIEDDLSYVERLAQRLVSMGSAFKDASLKNNIIDVSSWRSESGAERWAHALVQNGFNPVLGGRELSEWFSQANGEGMRPGGDPVFYAQMGSYVEDFRDAVLQQVRPKRPAPAPGWEGPWPEKEIGATPDLIEWLDTLIKVKEHYIPQTPLGREVRKGDADGRTLRNAYRLIDELGITGAPPQARGPFSYHDEVAELRNLRRWLKNEGDQHDDTAVQETTPDKQTEQSNSLVTPSALQDLCKMVCRDSGELYRWCGQAIAVVRHHVEGNRGGNRDSWDAVTHQLALKARDHAISIQADASALQLFGGVQPADHSVMSASTGLTLLQSLADWSAAKDAANRIAAGERQREQEEQRRQTAIEYRPWLVRLAGHTNEFSRALPSRHQNDITSDLVGANRYEVVADAFLSYVNALKGENCRNENAYDRLRRSWEHASNTVVRELYRVAGAGDRAGLVELIRQVAKMPPMDQFEVYRDAKWITDGVVNQTELTVCNLAIEAQRAPGGATPRLSAEPSPYAPADEPIMTAASSHEEKEKGIEADGADLTEETVLSPSRKKAYAQYLSAVTRNAALDGATDLQVYNWVTEHVEEDEKLPPFATWSRYLREARAACETRKNSRRAGRETGRNIARQEDL
jgi:hypothetical protein